MSFFVFAYIQMLIMKEVIPNEILEKEENG